MPKNKFQDVVFTIIMAAIMVYGMVGLRTTFTLQQTVQTIFC